MYFCLIFKEESMKKILSLVAVFAVLGLGGCAKNKDEQKPGMTHKEQQMKKDKKAKKAQSKKSSVKKNDKKKNHMMEDDHSMKKSHMKKPCNPCDEKKKHKKSAY